MSFDPYNCFLKIQESIGILTPNVGAHLGVWGFIPLHFLTLPRAWNVTLGLYFWLAPLQALALVVGPMLELWYVKSKKERAGGLYRWQGQNSFQFLLFFFVKDLRYLGHVWVQFQKEFKNENQAQNFQNCF